MVTTAAVIAIAPPSTYPSAVAPWWNAWAASLGTRASPGEARLTLDLPARIALLGKSAGLDPRSIAVRTVVAR